MPTDGRWFGLRCPCAREEVVKRMRTEAVRTVEDLVCRLNFEASIIAAKRETTIKAETPAL